MATREVSWPMPIIRDSNRKNFDDVKVMFLHGAAPGFIFTKNPVKSTADVKGLRIESQCREWDIVRNLGALL